MYTTDIQKNVMTTNYILPPSLKPCPLQGYATLPCSVYVLDMFVLLYQFVGYAHTESIKNYRIIF